MPQNPIDSLINLNEFTEVLDRMQTMVNESRSSNPQDQHVQLEMDRYQTSIDKRREIIRLSMLDISSRN
jgi:hypothetical protein